MDRSQPKSLPSALQRLPEFERRLEGKKAVVFGMAARSRELEMGATLNLVYTPRWNTSRGETKLELTVVDFYVGEP